MNNSKIISQLLLLLCAGSLAVAQTAPAGASPAEAETLHVLVGKSVIINVQAPLTRVLSSNPVVVEAMATSPTQVVIEGKTA